MIGDRWKCGDIRSRVVLITRKLPFFLKKAAIRQWIARRSKSVERTAAKRACPGSKAKTPALPNSDELLLSQVVITKKRLFFRPRVCRVGSAGQRNVGVYSGGVHLFPFRTEQLSPPALMVLR